MTTYYMNNYTGAEITVPEVKYPKGEMTGKKRVLIDRKTLVTAAGTAGLDATDVIYGPKLPADSIVTNVSVHINKSLGATGIFSVGWAANHDINGDVVDALDADGFISAVDAGGQAALTSMTAGQPGVFKRFAEETQILITCTEVMDDNVLDGVLTLVVEYVND